MHMGRVGSIRLALFVVSPGPSGMARMGPGTLRRLEGLTAFTIGERPAKVRPCGPVGRMGRVSRRFCRASRSQANSATLSANDPTPARMKEWEQLAEILSRTRSTFVFGSGDLSEQDRALVGGTPMTDVWLLMTPSSCKCRGCAPALRLGIRHCVGQAVFSRSTCRLR